MSSHKSKFTSYGGAAMAPAAPDGKKSVEYVVDPSRTYGKVPKAVSASRTEFQRIAPNQSQQHHNHSALPSTRPTNAITV